MLRRRVAGVATVALAGLAVIGVASVRQARADRQPAPSGLAKLRHIVIIMQENRSFDHYFGTFPGADGIPFRDGVPTVCVPEPDGGPCVRPYYDPNDLNR